MALDARHAARAAAAERTALVAGSSVSSKRIGWRRLPATSVDNVFLSGHAVAQSRVLVR